ncbi:hypothetical protein, partial [Methylocella sp.]|uniref:hypothetical protein n=1 Tax=Methylocella sp. TaxID=1978226 RepID=UPI003783AC58
MSLHETPAGAERAFSALDEDLDARPRAPVARRGADELDRRLKHAMRQLAAQGARSQAALDVSPSLKAMAALLAEPARAGAARARPGAEAADGEPPPSREKTLARLDRRLGEI